MGSDHRRHIGEESFTECLDNPFSTNLTLLLLSLGRTALFLEELAFAPIRRYQPNNCDYHIGSVPLALCPSARCATQNGALASRQIRYLA